MAAKLLTLLLVGLITRYSYGLDRQNEIILTIPQAQELWNNRDILGNSTTWNHPLDSGTFTTCDETVMTRAFDSNYQLNMNYTYFDDSWSIDTRATKVYLKNYAYRYETPDRTIEKDIYTAGACIMACVAEKDFECRELDYFRADGGVCALYDTTGNYGDSRHPLFVGNSASSDHYRIYRGRDSPPPCNVTEQEYAYHYFALGWKAMETGWYNLAQSQLNIAIDLDPDYYMAYIGKALANSKLGYGKFDDKLGMSYTAKLLEIEASPDKNLRLTFQEQLLLDALIALHTADTLEEGLVDMDDVFNEDTETLRDYVLAVIRGYGLLLSQGSHITLENAADDYENVYALQLLTRTLNPYRAGSENKTSELLMKAAIKAVFTYQGLNIRGAAEIAEDCVDISEYYGRWALAFTRLQAQRDFLYTKVGTSPNDLFTVNNGTIVLQGLNMDYMSVSLQLINEYERLHFYELQLALFHVAEADLNHVAEMAAIEDDEERSSLRLRMAANAYFTTYDYIYEPYAKKINFTEDWMRPLSVSTNDLALASRAYYWTAAAIQKLRSGQDEDGVSDIKSALIAVGSEVTNEPYQELISLYEIVITGTELKMADDKEGTLESARQAAATQDILQKSDFTLQGVPGSSLFKMLIPLGYQFEADMLRELYAQASAAAEADEEVTQLVSVDELVVSFKRNCDTPPLNISRFLKGYGDALREQHGNTPKTDETTIPAHIEVYERLLEAWKDSDANPEDFPVKAEASNTIETFYDAPVTGCLSDAFQIVSGTELCWGGYVIIGVSVAVVVLIAIVVGILCLRKKATAPAKNKDKEKAFIFSGPTLSRRDSFNSYQMGTMSTGSPTPYASQTLDLKRNLYQDDYTSRSHTIDPHHRQYY